MAPADVEYVLGELEPTRLTASGNMKQAGELRIRQHSGCNLYDRIGEIESTRWVAELIGDHPDLVPGQRQSQHGFHEIGAEGAINPGCAKYRVPWLNLVDGRFSSELRQAINASWPGFVVFMVGSGFVSGEYVVCRQVNQWQSQSGGSCRHGLRSIAIYGKRQFFLFLGTVDGRVSSRIHHHIRRMPSDDLLQIPGRSEVQFGAPGRHDHSSL